jgi:hypothetical protein
MPEEPMTPQKKGPSPTEALLFYSIVKNMKNKADVDWDTVAAESGFKNAGVAKVRYSFLSLFLFLFWLFSSLVFFSAFSGNAFSQTNSPTFSPITGPLRPNQKEARPRR